jgi:protein-L-isoaspartate(D-aspartate) O-methyltransferase
MTDFAQARRMMVDGQIRTSDVTDLDLLAAFGALARERFVPERRQAIAYLDLDVPLDGAGGRALMKPMVLAKLIQAAEVGTRDRVLVVGCGTGYSAAILAQLAGTVVALEEDAALAKAAAQLAAGDKVEVVTGPLAAGWSKAAPYAVILLDGAAEVVPPALFDQLGDGGRLVGVIGRAPIGRGTVYRRSGAHVSARAEFDAVGPLLPGFAKPPAFVF